MITCFFLNSFNEKKSLKGNILSDSLYRKQGIFVLWLNVFCLSKITLSGNIYIKGDECVS